MRTRGLGELALTLFGLYAFRCGNCGRKFLSRPMGVGGSVYAKCPRCYRMDLTTWDQKYYRASFWESFKTWFGAHRWRCEPCRTNFVSWRPRKEKYVRPAAPLAEEEDWNP